MENASKALIMAGAVLVAIVIISMGVVLLKNSEEPVNISEDVGDTLAVQTFNQTFLQYIGTNKGSTIKQLVIAASTVSNKSDAKHKVTVSGADSLEPYADYEIKATDITYDKDGYVTSISVHKK